MEVSVADSTTGAVFTRSASIRRKNRRSLGRRTTTCSATRREANPGHIIRSVYTDREGQPVLSEGSFRIDQSSPINHRWGGWYVTGTHGKQTHSGISAHRSVLGRAIWKTRRALNVTELKGKIDIGMAFRRTATWSLMVMEHQAEMYNRITTANYQTRLAVRDADIINELDTRKGETDRRHLVVLSTRCGATGELCSSRKRRS